MHFNFCRAIYTQFGCAQSQSAAPQEITAFTKQQVTTPRPPPTMAEAVQTFGKKKVRSHTIIPLLTDTQTATAVAYCKTGKGLIKVNGSPINLVQPEILRFKVLPLLPTLHSVSYFRILLCVLSCPPLAHSMVLEQR